MEAAGTGIVAEKEASEFKLGDYIVLKDRPCRIVERYVSKTGKHGYQKVMLLAIDIITLRKHEHLCPSHHVLKVPCVTKTEFELLDIAQEKRTVLLGKQGDLKEGLLLPDDEVGRTVETLFTEGNRLSVTVISAMGEEAIVGIKIAAEEPAGT